MVIDKMMEAYLENVADKAAEKAISGARREWSKDIKLHSAECAAGKYIGLKHTISAAVGGALMAGANWILGRL